ncbi:MAG: eIF2 kinase Gcn2p negative regulator [Geoglossum umbratile]|nr:MAG: eIF2 kinase Gcn2p negative regulator [Geoglossum umbratile]
MSMGEDGPSHINSPHHTVTSCIYRPPTATIPTIFPPNANDRHWIPVGKMNEALQDEIEAINSIYGDGTIRISMGESSCILRLPEQSISIRLRFPQDYPDKPPTLLGSETSGEHTRKGEASRVVGMVQEILSRTYRPGEVCLFDLLEEVGSMFVSEQGGASHLDEAHDGTLDRNMGMPENHAGHEGQYDKTREAISPDIREPPWVSSEVVSEKKSVFIARCAAVSTTAQAKGYLCHLISTNRKVANATHNITAWRIKGSDGVSYQDCDDDGETAAGGRLLHLMQLMDVWDVMVIVTRWYGGIQLGPDRFRIINSVARGALVRGGYVKAQMGIGSSAKKKEKK